MNISEQQDLWLRLKAEGLVEGELPPATTATAPWFVRVMQGVGGWIAALFLLGFVGSGLAFVFRSSGIAFIFGLAACAAASAIFKTKSDNDFASQFGMALSLAGQGLVLFALIDNLHSQTSAVALGMALFQVVLFIVIPNFVHRVWTAGSGAMAIVYALMDWHLLAYAPGILSLACTWVWLNEFQDMQHANAIRPGGYGLTLALMMVVTMLASTSHTGMFFFNQRLPVIEYHVWIGAGVSGLALLWAVYRLLIREGVQPASRAGVRMLAATSILAIATLKAPGLAPATLILLLGFSNGNRVLFGLGVAALLGYLSFYYYSLEITLLQKSELMAATGIALLTARYMLLHWWPSQPGEHHA